MSMALLTIDAGYVPDTRRRLIDCVWRAMAHTLALPVHELRIQLEECPAVWRRSDSSAGSSPRPSIRPTAEEVAAATAKLLAN